MVIFRKYKSVPFISWQPVTHHVEMDHRCGGIDETLLVGETRKYVYVAECPFPHIVVSTYNSARI